MDKYNEEMTPEIYRKLLEKNFKENRERANRIKINFNLNRDPICQKEDRYIPPKTKGKLVTKNKNEENKEIKRNFQTKRQIIRKGNFGSGPNVITEEPIKRGKRFHSAERRLNDSFQKRPIERKPNELSLKNFYQDYYNTVKPNFNDKYIAKRKWVSKYKIYILLIII